MSDEKKQDYIPRPNRFEAKLSWKRKAALRMVADIKTFIEEQTGYELPEHKHIHTYRVDTDENINAFDQEFHELINLYYILQRVGWTVGSLFENQDGEYKTVPIMHLYSRNRVDPVWNWRKSQLIRTIFKHYIHEKQLWETTLPVHMVLTVPHAGGVYKGRKFFGDLILKDFNTLRKQVEWKKFVDGGEYGMEVKRGRDGNGLHIHIHSLVLLRKGKSFEEFKRYVNKAWESLTGATQMWVEPLYFFKKDTQGHFITETKSKMKLQTGEEADGMYMTDSVDTGDTITFRKKFYVDKEIKSIKRDPDLTEAEKTAQIESIYLAGIMETIKYHFKQDSFFQKDDYTTDTWLLHEVLQNTKYKRLFGRFGSMYAQPELNFNNVKNLLAAEQLQTPEPAEQLPQEEPATVTVPEEESPDQEILMAKAKREVINPFTGEPVPIEETKMVIYLAENRHFNSASGIRPYYEYRDTRELMMQLNTANISVIARKLAEGKINELLLSQSQPKPKPQPQSQPKPKPQPQSQPKPQPKPQPQSQPQPQPKPQSQPKPQPKPKPKPKPKPQPQSQPQPTNYELQTTN